jgi:molybdopterin/thiamine biosynthesis adenylyltransferase
VRLSDEQTERYSGNILLPEVGERGQTRLLGAKVLVAGAGGLGSPAALYLAAAGVGTIGIADSDAVELSNLQRQILHGTSDVGRPKTGSAARRIRAVNPEVQVITHRQRLTSRNILDVIGGYDFVVDGTDNFATRYLINDACVMANKPLSHGAVLRFEGQITTIVPRQGPCYRCLYPEPPPPGLVPNCQQAGVLNAVAGVIGAMQAAEAIKWIVGAGEPLVGRLVLFDALNASFREVAIRRDPRCALCGERPTVTEPIDYDEFCGRG